MLIFTVIVAVLAAWHFGFKAGLIAGISTFVLLIAALVMPMHAIKIYVALGIGVVGMCVIGPRVSRDEARPVKRTLRTAYKVGKGFVNQIRRRLK